MCVLEDLKLRQKRSNYPLPESTYRHKKTGNLYTVDCVANTSGDRWPHIVVYYDASGVLWARPVSEWMERYEYETEEKQTI